MEWFKVSDKPKEDRECLVTDGEIVKFGFYNAKDNTWRILLNNGSFISGNNSVKHWMPVPKPPVE